MAFYECIWQVQKDVGYGLFVESGHIEKPLKKFAEVVELMSVIWVVCGLCFGQDTALPQALQANAGVF